MRINVYMLLYVEYVKAEAVVYTHIIHKLTPPIAEMFIYNFILSPYQPIIKRHSSCSIMQLLV